MTDDGAKAAPKRDIEDEREIPSRQQVENALRTLIDAVVPQDGPAPTGGRQSKPKRKR
jgi:hypothetical protein